ncbi:helix-turn-helix domain-containing protein [Sulfuricurvum sp. IAE1]|uniref:helix-turn-helix domain-containing protein n=1 Tax=Sulfuricurvum sp. IAE1 TaxID=2546102 RepID=UPI00104B8CBB|nr:helix-turn-helix domain-containing protein [Sulfuricurvum sp. IAE1]TDA63579.1 helix-turn-helix domain-containing protein [Sulfuricurvum sp. IAE1]
MSARLHKSYSNNFTITPNHIINDEKISLKAKGLYLYLVSKPDNWAFSIERISKESKDGEDSVKSAIKELEKCGYLTRSQFNKNGNFGSNIYTLFDEPLPSGENPPTVTVRGKTASGKTASGKTASGKSPDLIKKREVKNNTERENFSVAEIVDDVSDHRFPHIENFLDFVCKSSRIKNPLAYRSQIRASLLDEKNKRHKKTLYAYETFVRRTAVHNFPNGFDVFGVYESLGFQGVSHE